MHLVMLVVVHYYLLEQICLGMLQVDQFTKGHWNFSLQICMCNTEFGEFTMRRWARNRIISRMPEDTRFEVKPRNILHFTDSLYLGSSSASSQSSPGFSCDNLQSNYSVSSTGEKVSNNQNLTNDDSSELDKTENDYNVPGKYCD